MESSSERGCQKFREVDPIVRPHTGWVLANTLLKLEEVDSSKRLHVEWQRGCAQEEYGGSKSSRFSRRLLQVASS